jgi:hypothetical protein
MGDIFGRMNRQCYEKCIAESIRDGTAFEDELSLDEEKCLVNCATKFVRVLCPLFYFHWACIWHCRPFRCARRATPTCIAWSTGSG